MVEAPLTVSGYFQNNLQDWPNNQELCLITHDGKNLSNNARSAKKNSLLVALNSQEDGK